MEWWADLPGDPLINPIIKHAGQDISHWFDKETGEVLNLIYYLGSNITS